MRAVLYSIMSGCHHDAMALLFHTLASGCRPSRPISEDEDSQNIEMIRDSPGAMLGGRNMVQQPLLLYHETEQDKDRDLLPISNMTILLFIKFYDPKTENLKVGEAYTGSRGPSCTDSYPSKLFVA